MISVKNAGTLYTRSEETRMRPVPVGVPSRATFSVDGRRLGARVAADGDGYTVESTDFPACWAFAPTLEGALESLAEQVAPALAAHPLPPLPPRSLDRRPDLRARFARVVARALGS
jgi:predicted RNase H-like HicB family nuclease